MRARSDNYLTICHFRPSCRSAELFLDSPFTALKKLLQLAMDGLLALSSAPLFLIPSAGVITLSLGLVGLLLWLLSKAGTALSLDNTALLCACTILTGIQIIGLGIVAIYLARVLDEVRGRPTYIVGELFQNGKRSPDDKRELPTAFIETAGANLASGKEHSSLDENESPKAALTL